MTDTLNKSEFAKCVVKKTGLYYKWIITGAAIVAALIAVVYGIVVTMVAYMPIVTDAILSVPPLAFIPVGIVVIPIIAATIVCWAKRGENEIKKADEEFICPE
jgi:uncharacterized membrane protein